MGELSLNFCAFRVRLPSVVASVFAPLFLWACPGMYNPPINPNILSCDWHAGEAIAAPMDVTSDCWDDEAMLKVVVRGESPADAQNIIPLAVKPRYPAPSLARNLSAQIYRNHDAGSCMLEITEPDTGLKCIGLAIDASFDCTKPNGSACKVRAELPEGWGGVHDYTKLYSKEFPASEYPDN